MDNAMPGGLTAALAIPKGALSTMGYGLFGTAVGNRNSYFWAQLLLGLFTSWCGPASAAPTKHAGRHGRYYVAGKGDWRCFELHLALYRGEVGGTPYGRQGRGR